MFPVMMAAVFAKNFHSSSPHTILLYSKYSKTLTTNMEYNPEKANHCTTSLSHSIWSMVRSVTLASIRTFPSNHLKLLAEKNLPSALPMKLWDVALELHSATHLGMEDHKEMKQMLWKKNLRCEGKVNLNAIRSWASGLCLQQFLWFNEVSASP